MLVGDLSRPALARSLRGSGIHLNTGAFTTRLVIDLPDLVDQFAEMYARYPLDDPPGIDDAEVRITRGSLWQRMTGRKAYASTDTAVMEGVPAARAFTAMETALNWAAAASDVAPMVMHSAVLERMGRALILPAPSGSGKSTLSAALAWRGWRLLSDEMAVFAFDDLRVHANPRPVSLKNQAIEVVAAFEPRARFSRVYAGTAKGDVAYMAAPDDAIAHLNDPADPALVIIPTYVAGSATVVEPIERAESFRWLVDSTVNYRSLLRTGFEMMTGIVERCSSYRLRYSDLDGAIASIDRLHEHAVNGTRPA